MSLTNNIFLCFERSLKIQEISDIFSESKYISFFDNNFFSEVFNDRELKWSEYSTQIKISYNTSNISMSLVFLDLIPDKVFLSNFYSSDNDFFIENEDFYGKFKKSLKGCDSIGHDNFQELNYLDFTKSNDLESLGVKIW